MKLRQLIEKKETVGIIFGRFNPPHKGHKNAWKMCSENTHWYVGTNPNTVGIKKGKNKDPLPFAIKEQAMKLVHPEVSEHIVEAHSWLAMAADVYAKHGDVELKVYTDESWVFETIDRYNGESNDHGHYNFSKITHVSTPRIASATALRDAVENGDRETFTEECGIDADTVISGEKFFDIVESYMVNPVSATSARKAKPIYPEKKKAKTPSKKEFKLDKVELSPAAKAKMKSDDSVKEAEKYSEVFLKKLIAKAEAMADKDFSQYTPADHKFMDTFFGYHLPNMLAQFQDLAGAAGVVMNSQYSESLTRLATASASMIMKEDTVKEELGTLPSAETIIAIAAAAKMSVFAVKMMFKTAKGVAKVKKFADKMGIALKDKVMGESLDEDRSGNVIYLRFGVKKAIKTKKPLLVGWAGFANTPEDLKFSTAERTYGTTHDLTSLIKIVRELAQDKVFVNANSIQIYLTSESITEKFPQLGELVSWAKKIGNDTITVKYKPVDDDTATPPGSSGKKRVKYGNVNAKKWSDPLYDYTTYFTLGNKRLLKFIRESAPSIWKAYRPHRKMFVMEAKQYKQFRKWLDSGMAEEMFGDPQFEVNDELTFAQDYRKQVN